MSKKFTGITSAGSAIPVYDKDAHSALQNKADVSALTAYQEKSEMTAFQPVGDYYSASNPSGFLTAVPAEYATSGDLEDLSTAIAETFQPQSAMTAYLTAVPEGYATTEDLESATSGLQEKGDYYSASNPSGFITGVDLTPYQPKSAMTAYQTVEDMSAYQPSGDYLTAVPDTYLQNTDLSTTNGKITAISGIPLSAGGSALPISAGQGVKMEFVDGKLLFKTDETVLWTGANNSTAFTLSEPIYNFDCIELVNEKNTNSCRIKVDGTVSAGFNYNRLWLQPDNTIMQRYYAVTSNDGITFGVRYVRGVDISTANAYSYGGGSNWYLENTKIVGIGRKSGGN